MCTIVTKERIQLNIENYSCQECNFFCRFWWFGHWFFISFLILNWYNISSITPNTCISFIHRVRLSCTCKSVRKHAKYISTCLSKWDFATPHNLCWRYEMFKKIESSDRGSGQHVWGHLEYCEKTKAFFLLGVTYKQAQSWTKFSAW